MSTYRKKPVEIEAWHWLFNDSQEESPTWMNDSLHRWPEPNSANFEPDHPEGSRITIRTLEGDMIARPGDWIIKGVQDELYPCKDDIFTTTYEPVDV